MASKSDNTLKIKAPKRTNQADATQGSIGAPHDFAGDQAEIASLIDGSHANPFAFLGMHKGHGFGGLTVRCFLPGALSAFVVARDDQSRAWPLLRLHNDGLFGARIEGQEDVFVYRLLVDWGNGPTILEDPYRFGSVLSAKEVLRFRHGQLWRAWQCLGARATTIEEVDGYSFAVWAPHARRVSVVGQFNNWDGRRHTMRKLHDAGIWEIFIPGLSTHDTYKYEIVSSDGVLQPLKSDPFGQSGELRPANASKLVAPALVNISDESWLSTRRARHQMDAPISTYEVHAGSFRRKPEEGNRPLTYPELGDYLVPYVKDLGFTHVQFMPLTEYPYDGSWGYQPVGLFAATSRYGTPEQFRELVARLHNAGIGVLCDFVPAHFPVDPHGLNRFDGTALYEHEDPRLGFHPDWKTNIYNFGKLEVINFLVSSALFWLDRFKIDGLRVDAVSSMLYLDYSRNDGEWLPNIYGGNINLEAVEFMRRLNEMCYGEAEGIMMIAEESTAWPGVCKPTYDGGLGFGFKWNLGWMHDTLQYMSRDPIHRAWHHGEITFGLAYAWSENFVLALSHDEVVHGKGSIFSRMPGDSWQRYANLRAYYALMWAHPGKKLMFMGAEFGQVKEWNHDGSLDWHLLEDPAHRGVQDLIRDLNHLYIDMPALHQVDCDPAGFEWVQSDAGEVSVFAWLRWNYDRSQNVLTIFNMTPVPREGYRVGVSSDGVWKVILNTDSAAYGGSEYAGPNVVAAQPHPYNGQPFSVELTLPPLSGLYVAKA
jgi:1,4-alpha-glucan branching enzyme